MKTYCITLKNRKEVIMEKIIDTDGNVGFKSGKHINVRKQYNCTGKYKEIPVETLWEEVMIFNPDKDFEYETVIKVKD